VDANQIRNMVVGLHKEFMQLDDAKSTEQQQAARAAKLTEGALFLLAEFLIDHKRIATSMEKLADAVEKLKNRV
jgi:hypothetical protein